MKNALSTACFVALSLLTIGCSSIKAQQGGPAAVVDYDSCIAAGFPMVKTYPARCITKEGKVFFQKTVQRIQNGKTAEDRVCSNQCGNGVCQQIVCMGSDCPCAETPQNCPQDCAERGF